MAYPTVSGPYGLIPVKLLSGTPFVGGVYRQMKIASGYNTAIFFGDAVTVVTGGTVERDAFDGHDVGLSLARHPHHPVQRLRH